MGSHKNIEDILQSPDVNKETTTIKKSAAKTESSEKVLTGMDRYITITKRKSSPRAASTLEPHPKQAKNNTDNANRFAILAEKEKEDNTPAKKNFKPPPLYLREPTTNALVTKLTQIVGKDNFYVVSLRKGNIQETKIQAKDEKIFRAIVNKFDTEKKNYYTYQLKSAKGLNVIIKGIDSTVPISDIKNALQSEGYEVKSIHNILNKNKIPQPLFRVEIEFNSNNIRKKGDNHPIYGLRYLLNRRIYVEEPIKRKGPPQCQNCQEFGHTKSFCKLPAVCVRCGDVHRSSECPHPKTEVSCKKCSNCGENHTANYRGCKVYLELKNKAVVKRPIYNQYRESNFPSLPQPTIPQQANSKNVAQTKSKFPDAFSYADALKEGIPTAHSNSQNSIETLIQTMSNFMANMQNMLQQLLQNQNMLMQILVNKT